MSAAASTLACKKNLRTGESTVRSWWFRREHPKYVGTMKPLPSAALGFLLLLLLEVDDGLLQPQSSTGYDYNYYDYGNDYDYVPIIYKGVNGEVVGAAGATVQ